MTITELQENYPFINWLEYLNSLMPAETKFTTDDTIINAVPTFFEKLGPLIDTTPNDAIQNYLMWRFAAASVSYMGKAFRDRQQEYSRITTGKETADPRGLTCSDIALSYFPHALGSLYVRKHFDEAAKQNVMDMVDNLKVAFKEILDEIDWMDATTKEAAHGKADAMKSQMAYADELRNDAKLTEYYTNFDAEIDVANYYDSIFRLSIASTQFSLNRLNQPVDKDDWAVFVTPAIVNAFYSSLENTIKFPAGILQGAFFNADRPHYMNYGAIGFVIGHEVSDGFLTPLIRHD
jgi:membrane metallo-endopeptidase-like protein 1